MSDDPHSDDSVWRDPEFEQAVRDTAYFMWEQDGRPAGREKDYWFRAMEQHLRMRRNEKELRDGMQ
ncbi:DUF2934 domain-containing protein [Paradevosia shaoguanensis]|jgi:hypothetical protein|uniref:DUF2934 domain-containing protein n=1 Tax=Paradevosia shaoguanensis TaxID=1335043 RepID=A0AA41QR12_9HYPH|nr:DUF2934 domain-containing protein [Paradevosia shaoguanensis]KFL27301.1 hypothetical protein JP74_08355 [Devosia sp. 17-2-E-8]MBI4046464.1 DUF2934 domain-containing protein [Devosia nanyangense]QMV00948.1 DUF2934 domain-containing protein [Devosia sp. D6-9]CDP52442.1 hypothetical protein [Devosia sp. DBB001]MCF1744265.1 DUF2934 domain-containing protein [Paradevosia shaoguanensis]